MKKLSLIVVAFLLTGCLETVPVKRNFPQVPDELKEVCPDLTLVADNETKLSAVLDTIVQNYAKYHECQIKVDLWIDWYKQQKQIFEDVK